MIYPYTDPQILNDEIFVSYGGSTGTTTQLQRQAAYFVAEEWMSEHFNTPVVPTIMTGTYGYPYVGNTVQLEYAYLQDVYRIDFLDNKGTVYHTIDGLDNYDAAIRNSDRSILDIFYIYGNCYGCRAYTVPYQFRISYCAGLPSGIYTKPNFLLALTGAATLALNEIKGYGNETVGGVGIESFRNQEYAEKRLPIARSAFGNSAKADWITRLVASIRKRMLVGL